MVPWNSALGRFAYNWQSKWVGIISIKTERTQIHFLSDVLVAVPWEPDARFPVSVKRRSCVRPAADETKLPVAREKKGNLSKDVFERRTSTRSEAFSLFIRLDANKFVVIIFFSLIKTIYPRIWTKPLPIDGKSQLPVDVRPSKTLLLKLPKTKDRGGGGAGRAVALPLLLLGFIF